MAESKPLTIEDLIEQGYVGYSIRHLLSKPSFRQKVINDTTVRGNVKTKHQVMDKLAVGGKVLITGPTGEAKTLFARVLLNHITREINNHKHHIRGCPFLEDAGYLVNIAEIYQTNVFQSLEALQSLCPFCRITIEKKIEEELNQKITLDSTDDLIKIGSKLVDTLKKIETEKTVVRRYQIDPRTDPESLYILLAGVENLEKLLGGETTTTYGHETHKVGVLSQGMLVVNEIQRLPLTLLEALMGFLEDPLGVKYNIMGEPVFVDGAIIFTSNAPLNVFGEESQPILNRIPEVLWPARNLSERIEIVRDMFKDQLILSRKPITSNPAMIRMYELTGEGQIDIVSRLAIEFMSQVANESIPNALQSDKGGIDDKSLMSRLDFYSALDQIHNPQRNPHLDLRTLNNAIGETVISKFGEDTDDIDQINVITLERVREVLDKYQVPSNLVNDALQETKLNLRSFIRDKGSAISVEEVSKDLERMRALTDEQISDIIIRFEDLSNLTEDDEELSAIVKALLPSYEQLIRVDYL
ncbi:MAG: hypothetical protein KAR35_01560 [Candidatus Heimdallarchaeota archaeon]|nr:hypothetical protein [Candidatus Heimdallarchaeota archaeon]MCK5048042.1 hypothetical protein [Candidatus Heimdallarchaeota archaeon]